MATIVSAAQGGTGQDTSAKTGQVEVSAGTWYFHQNHINVKTYGAIGNAVADDTSAIQAALTAGTGKVVYFPPGNYKISAPLTVYENTNVVGSGRSVTTVTQTTTANGFNTELAANGVTFSGLYVVAYPAHAGGDGTQGIYVNGSLTDPAEYHTIRDL
jgi:hypothetical protein